MIDLFYPPQPTTRKGRRVLGLTPAEEVAEYHRPKGRDPIKAKARQARYRARLRLDEARYEKYLEQRRQWHRDNREHALAQMKARRAAKRSA
jgi:hypothetical protein